MSAFIFFRDPHGGKACFLALLLLEQIGEVDEETFHAESRDQMHNEDRADSRRPSDINDSFFCDSGFFLQLIDAISRALFVQLLFV